MKTKVFLFIIIQLVIVNADYKRSDQICPG